eukprot:CAMPEP_0206057344 /NCGR_PEP_ID=MMETSP1466-20131121/44194_1 /ASSEMBLY_ACC=CAM_ASM_001126 /TAXON_ID=44452 /ORGANISM="Pavlova gyrans, Strain CCMP608" /LENGTH=90 /DNA_ID=CAMNT_0053432617 /DNA_START=93 /DNA_END=365 /DNA_ORIENTATION=+
MGVIMFCGCQAPPCESSARHWSSSHRRPPAPLPRATPSARDLATISYSTGSLPGNHTESSEKATKISARADSLPGAQPNALATSLPQPVV